MCPIKLIDADVFDVFDVFVMAFLKKLFQGSSKGKKKEYPNITSGADPLEKWRKIGELGDGAFGTVFKVTLHNEFHNIVYKFRLAFQDLRTKHIAKRSVLWVERPLTLCVT